MKQELKLIVRKVQCQRPIAVPIRSNILHVNYPCSFLCLPSALQLSILVIKVMLTLIYDCYSSGIFLFWVVTDQRTIGVRSADRHWFRK